MNGLDDIAEAIEAEMDEKDEIREIALKSSRSVIRLCSSAIRMIHKEKEDVNEILAEAQEELHRLKGITKDFPALFHSGFVESAMQEYAEAIILHAITSGQDIPGPEKLGVTSEGYLLGMGDVIGELRRQAVDSLRHGRIEKASGYLDIMEELYEFIMRFHYPSSMVAIKRKQDIARGVIEKTRGEVAVAIRTHALEKKISGGGDV